MKPLYLFNGNANDESGNNNHGIINRPKPSINRFDKTNSSYLFNGTSDYIKIPNHTPLNSIEKEFTISAWIIANDITKNGYYEIIRNGTFLFSFQEHGTQLTLGINGDRYVESDTPINPSSITNNKWHNLIGIDDGNKFYVYIDGVKIGTKNHTPNQARSSAYDTYIGSLGGIGEFFNGNIDDIRIYNRALSESEVQELYTETPRNWQANWQPTTTRLSLTSGNHQANAANYAPAISADGRYLAFASDATNLVSGDTNNATDIFLRDRVTQTVKLITKGGNGDSLRPAISADGRYVAYESTASNLAEGDTNNAIDIFRYDRVTGTTVRVSVASGGAQGDGDSISAALSDDGSRVAFASAAGNLVSGDTNNAFDVFVRDVAEDNTARASVGTTNVQGDGDSLVPALSGDGRNVAFASAAANLVDGDTNASYDIFLRDTQANTTARVSVRTGASALQANRDSWQPQLNTDGSLVVFASDASNLVARDRNQVADIFIRNLAANGTYRLSRTDQIKEANAPSYRPRISGSGRYVAFQSDAALTAADTNQAADIYVFDRTTQKLARISVSTSGTQGDGQSLAPALSGDGRYVAFESDSTNLVKGDTNQAWDIFVRDLGKGLTPTYPLSARKTAPDE